MTAVRRRYMIHRMWQESVADGRQQSGRRNLGDYVDMWETSAHGEATDRWHQWKTGRWVEPTMLGAHLSAVRVEKMEDHKGEWQVVSTGRLLHSVTFAPRPDPPPADVVEGAVGQLLAARQDGDRSTVDEELEKLGADLERRGRAGDLARAMETAETLIDSGWVRAARVYVRAMRADPSLLPTGQ